MQYKIGKPPVNFATIATINVTDVPYIFASLCLWLNCLLMTVPTQRKLNFDDKMLKEKKHFYYK